MLTFHVQTRKVILQVVYSCEQDLDVQDELLRHSYCIDVLPIANLPEHVRDARRTRLFKCRQDTVNQSTDVRSHTSTRNANTLTSRCDIPAAPS